MKKTDFPDPFEITLATGETLLAEVFTTGEHLVRADDRRESLKKELEHLILRSFPKLSEEYRNELVAGYFDRPGNGFERYVFLLRNHLKDLIASTMFDYGRFEYDRQSFTGIYSVLRVVSPGYEGMGLAQQMAIQEFIRFKPDVLFSSSYQSAALHSWIRLCDKGLLTGYEVFPRFEKRGGEEKLVTVPLKELDFAVNAFLSAYRGFAQKDETIKRAMRNLTLFLARKNAHGEAYEFHPWEKDGRKDRLASELGLGEQDAMLVMFRKTI